LFRICLPALILLSSCFIKRDKTEGVLARVNKDYLYASELTGVVPTGTTPKDSILIVQNFINNWVQNKLILQKARNNLLKKDLRFEKQLEEYENSLIIYKYESKLISQSLDTVVTDKEIESYYTENSKNFQLKDNIVKVYYARFSNTLPELREIRTLFNSADPEDRNRLENYIEQFSDLYYRDDETWVLFNDILKYVPINTYNEEAFLQNNRKLEISEGGSVYFVCFTDFMMKDGESPLSFERENIRQIILNKRKLRIINKMRQDVYQAALAGDGFKIY
jgi:hypothetical protein